MSCRLHELTPRHSRWIQFISLAWRIKLVVFNNMHAVLLLPLIRVHLYGRDYPPEADGHAVHSSPHGQLWPELLQKLHHQVLGQRWVAAAAKPAAAAGLWPASVLPCSGNLFVVQWDNVRLKDREAEGGFIFQAALHRNGTIVFNYRDVREAFD